MSDGPFRSSQHQTAAGWNETSLVKLRSAGERGDPSALAELATWYLRGEFVPRNLGEARALLRRAVEIGHVDAALMEIALIATGSGGPSSWSCALRRLQRAASSDPVARAQLDLVQAMSLSDDGFPNAIPAPEHLSERPLVLRHRALLSPSECMHIAFTAKEMLEPSMVVDPATGRMTAHPIRTSSGATIGPVHENLVVNAINRRIAAISNTHVSQGEPLAVLRYAPGEQYRPHHDCIAGATNQRIKTALIYLNDGFSGGETTFLRTGLKIVPRAGDVIVFDNTLPDGSIDRSADHAGLPVSHGNKWLATRWIRANRYDLARDFERKQSPAEG